MSAALSRAAAGLRWLASAVVLAQAGGCVSPPPRELDLRRMQIVVADAAPRLDVSGLPGGKAVGAGVGAGTGSGAGVLIGAAACVATGPFFPLCLAAVVPTTTVVGAVTGGIVGAVKTESVEALERKTRLLKDELDAAFYPQLLAEGLQAELLAARAMQVPAAAASTAAPATSMPWTLDVALTEIGTEGKSEFALRLVTRASLRRSDRAEAAWTVVREVQSETELTTSAWMQDGAGAVRRVLARCLRQAAHELAVELTRPVDARAAAAHPRSRGSSSCEDVPEDIVKASAS